MSILFIFILILFLLKIVRDSLFFMWLWQIKEYRIDRMISHLKNDEDMNKVGISYLVAIVLLFLLLRFPEYSFILFLAILAFFIFAATGTAKEIRSRSLKRPKPTIKIFSISFTTMLFLFPFAYLFTKSNEIAGIELLLFVYVVASSIISLTVFLLNPIFELEKRNIMRQAAAKMRSLKKTRTIGITGSYGKTSTKEFLYAILSQKFKVVKTEGNNNTNIGVAYTILNKVNDNCDYFICEMGAYRIGEIKEMCDIARPEIGILTGINEQHIELFGSIENTFKAKFELIEALPENGLAMINEKLKTKSEKIKFKTGHINFFSIKAADNIKVFRDYTEFIYKGEHFRLNLPGKHYIENLISAIIVSESQGMKLNEIKDAVLKIKPNEYMLRKSTGINDSVFVDDSYSANPDGVMAALDYISQAYPGYKKIIVFPGFIELGNESHKMHERSYNRILNACDVAFILNTKYSSLDANNRCKFIFEKDFDKVAMMLQNNLDKNTVVLFESRGAGAVMKKIKK